MSLYRRTLLALSVAVSCVSLATSAYAQARNPTAQDLARAFSERPAIIRQQLGACTPGTANGAELSVCRYCITWVAVAFEGRSPQQRSVLQVRQGPGSITFQRAVSYDAPTVQPMPGRPGVWVVYSSRQLPMMWIIEAVPSDISPELHYPQITGLRAHSESAMSERVWGGRQPPAMEAALQRDQSLQGRLLSLMPPCVA